MKRVAWIIAVVCVILLATTGHEPTDNGRVPVRVHEAHGGFAEP